MLTSETMAELSEEIKNRIENLTESCNGFEGELFQYDKKGGNGEPEPDMPRWKFVFGKDNVKESNISPEEA